MYLGRSPYTPSPPPPPTNRAAPIGTLKKSTRKLGQVVFLSRLCCFAFPRRDLSTKKTKPNIEKWLESQNFNISIMGYLIFLSPVTVLEVFAKVIRPIFCLVSDVTDTSPTQQRFHRLGYFEHFFLRKWKHRSVCVRIHTTVISKRGSKCYQNSRKCFYLVSSFLWLICKTFLIFKICGKIDLKINWSVKTPLPGHKGGTPSGLWAPYNLQKPTLLYLSIVFTW